MSKQKFKEVKKRKLSSNLAQNGVPPHNQAAPSLLNITTPYDQLNTNVENAPHLTTLLNNRQSLPSRNIINTSATSIPSPSRMHMPTSSTLNSNSNSTPGGLPTLPPFDLNPPSHLFVPPFNLNQPAATTPTMSVQSTVNHLPPAVNVNTNSSMLTPENHTSSPAVSPLYQQNFPAMQYHFLGQFIQNAISMELQKIFPNRVVN